MIALLTTGLVNDNPTHLSRKGGVWIDKSNSMEQITLTEREFRDLMDYSYSLPTGTTIGKRWKIGKPYNKPTQWYMGEYVKCDEPGHVGILWRRIVAVVRLKQTSF